MDRYIAILLILVSALLASNRASAQSSSSFEMRYFTDDPKANGETDFRGETAVFNTEQRMEFLRHYASFSKMFFQDEQLDFMVVFQHTVAGTGNVDVVIGPEDRIEPLVINWDDQKKVDLTVSILDTQQNEVASRVYRNVELEGGRTVKMLEGFKPSGLKEGYYFLIFEIN